MSVLADESVASCRFCVFEVRVLLVRRVGRVRGVAGHHAWSAHTTVFSGTHREDALVPVGAGNSAVVVDLPLCGPMLSPRVPHHVPIPGPRMERETPGQRPRPNCGHPQAPFSAWFRDSKDSRGCRSKVPGSATEAVRGEAPGGVGPLRLSIARCPPRAPAGGAGACRGTGARRAHSRSAGRSRRCRR